MTITRKIELGCGTLTGFCAILIFIVAFLRTDHADSHGRPIVIAVAGFLLIWVTPPLLVTTGSYVHAWKRKLWGYALLLAGGVLTLAGSLMLLAVNSWGHEWEKSFMLTPGVLAVITMITASMARRSEKEQN